MGGRHNKDMVFNLKILRKRRKYEYIRRNEMDFVMEFGKGFIGHLFVNEVQNMHDSEEHCAAPYIIIAEYILRNLSH